MTAYVWAISGYESDSVENSTFWTEGLQLAALRTAQKRLAKLSVGCRLYIIYGTVSAPRLKCYKNASRLNRYSFPTDNAIDFLFSTLHSEMV